MPHVLLSAIKSDLNDGVGLGFELFWITVLFQACLIGIDAFALEMVEVLFLHLVHAVGILHIVFVFIIDSSSAVVHSAFDNMLFTFGHGDYITVLWKCLDWQISIQLHFLSQTQTCLRFAHFGC